MLLKSYLSDRYFRVKYEDEYSILKQMSSGVPQGSVLGPILYLLYTRDLPKQKDSIIATFADDTAIITIDDDVRTATKTLQKSINAVNEWTKKWRIKINDAKSTHTNFTNRKVDTIRITLNNNVIPYSNRVKYLGMTLDQVEGAR